MPTLDLFNAAKAKGVAVFFITGRRDEQRAGHAAGISTATVSRTGPSSDDPPRQRLTIPSLGPRRSRRGGTSQDRAAGYTIIANIGISRATLTAVSPKHVQGAQSVLLHPLDGPTPLRPQLVGRPAEDRDVYVLVRRPAIAFDIGVFVNCAPLRDIPAWSARARSSGCFRIRKLPASCCRATCRRLENVAGHVGAQKRGDGWFIVDDGLVRRDEERAGSNFFGPSHP